MSEDFQAVLQIWQVIVINERNASPNSVIIYSLF